jgi:hypothetical protein
VGNYRDQSRQRLKKRQRSKNLHLKNLDALNGAGPVPRVRPGKNRQETVSNLRPVLDGCPILFSIVEGSMETPTGIVTLGIPNIETLFGIPVVFTSLSGHQKATLHLGRNLINQSLGVIHCITFQ